MPMASAQSPDRIVASTADVCVGEFRCPIDHPSFRNSGPASHDCFVFPRTAVVIRQPNGRIVADASVATLYNRAQEYEREPLSRDGDRCEWFGLSPRLLRALVGARDPRAGDDPCRPIRFTHSPVTDALYLAQRDLYRCAKRSVPDPLWLEESVVALAERVLDAAYGAAAPPPAMTPRLRDLVHDAQCLLARDPTAPHGLVDIADALGASVAHLSRSFRAGTGRTLHEHRTTLRLRASLGPLETATRGLTHVALAHGYSSHSHFTAAFHRAFGATPSQVRDLSAGRRSR
jgi:AraC-like DNA-binding protein